MTRRWRSKGALKGAFFFVLQASSGYGIQHCVKQVYCGEPSGWMNVGNASYCSIKSIPIQTLTAAVAVAHVFSLHSAVATGAERVCAVWEGPDFDHRAGEAVGVSVKKRPQDAECRVFKGAVYGRHAPFPCGSPPKVVPRYHRIEVSTTQAPGWSKDFFHAQAHLLRKSSELFHICIIVQNL